MPKGAKVDVSNIKVLDLAQAQKERLGSLLELTKPQVDRIKKRLRKEIELWMEETEELHRMLEEDNDLVEGIVDETDFPWEGAYNTHVPLTGTYMAIFRSVERRSILGADVIWYGEMMPGAPEALRSALAAIEEMMNYKARKEWNIADCLSDVIWNTNRDRLGILQIVYAEDYEFVSDTAIITGPEDFIAEFPTPEDAGLSARQYGQALEQIAGEATELRPVEIPYTAERVKYQGPKGYVIDLVNFAVFPPTVEDIDHENCRGYGKRFPFRKGVVRRKMKEGVWYKDAAKRILKAGEGATETPAFILAQEEIDGISRSDAGRDFWFFELVYKMDLGENGKARGPREKKFLFTYSFEHDELVSAMDYPYRVDHYALFKIEPRPNRLLAGSIPQMTRGLNDEVDVQHNQRNNSRTISSVPSFKARKGANNDFDPHAEENQWRPGVIFHLDEPDAFEQFKVQPVDLGESMAEESNNMKLLDLRTGAAASLLSGGVAPGDPSAPGNKTNAQIGQSNLRMDDPIFDLRKGVEKVGEICLSHEYQFGPMIIQFLGQTEDGQPVTKTIHKRFLKGVRMRMKAVTAANNPDAAFAQAMSLYAVGTKDPNIAQDPDSLYKLLRNAMRAGRIEGRDDLFPPLQVIKQRAIERQKAAMVQMEQEKQAAAAKQAQDAQKANLAEAKRSMQLRKTARDITDKALGLKRAARPAAAAGARGRAGAPGDLMAA